MYPFNDHYRYVKGFYLLKPGVHDTPHAHTSESHVPEAFVLSGRHVHHPASEVGLVIHEPVALHDIAGLAVRHAETLLDRFTVLHQLVIHASEVLPLIELHFIRSSVLYGDKQKCSESVITLFIRQKVQLHQHLK